jgi:hypothetical protein
MNQPSAMKTGLSRTADLEQAEATLRQVAALPAPAGLEARVHAVLESGARRGKVLPWPVAAHGGGASNWLRGAAAAAIVAVIVGGSWGIYARVQPGEPSRAVALPRVNATGGFANAGAMRTPQTLAAPAVSAQPKPAQTNAAAPKPVVPVKKRTTAAR